MPEMSDMIAVPFPRELYDDIVRFSDGKLDPVQLATGELRNLIEGTIEDHGDEWWGDRAYEVAEKYAPHVAEKWRNEDREAIEARNRQRRPLAWKEVTIPHGSEVRMQYGRDHSYARIEDGRIVDGGETYTPSEWASKVANGTSRNAWRDLWFKLPTTSHWTPATVLREQARAMLSPEDE